MRDIDDLLGERPEPVSDDGFTIRVMRDLPERRRGANDIWTLGGWIAAVLGILALFAVQTGMPIADAGCALSLNVVIIGALVAGFMVWAISTEV